jgi:hypothetical protein
MQGGYPPAGYERERKYSGSGGSPDLTRRLNEMSIGGSPYPDQRSGAPAYAMPRSRRGSFNAGVLEDAARTGSAVGSDYSANRRSTYGSPYVDNAVRYSGAPPPRPVSRSASPYRAHSPLPPSRSPRPGDTVLPGMNPAMPTAPGYGVPTTYVPGGQAPSAYGARPVSPYSSGTPLPGETIYPRGHVLEGQQVPRSPIPGLPSNAYGVNSAASGMPPIVGYAGSNSRPPSRVAAAVMPQAYHGADVGVPTGAPEAFSRPPNRSQPYTPFEPISLQELDNIVDHMPRMPLVLVPHDVDHGDWIRFMTVSEG